ncbi:MAG: (d)CMP kinase [Halobacteriales archaeon]
MRVTVSGPPGGGKSTTAASLAERYGLEHVSGGDIFRSLAAERDLSLAELNARAETDESIDVDLDRRLRRVARERDDVVLESRLAGWLAGDAADFRFWLDAPLAVRVARIADREGDDLEAVREATERRERSEARRYETYYGIDIGDRSIYDLSVNTARWSATGVLSILAAAIDGHDPASDEGSMPVEPVTFPE